MSDETVIAGFVAQCRAWSEQHDGEVPVAEICSGAPELAPLVRAALAFDSEMEATHRASVGLSGHEGSLIADRYQVAGRLGAGAMGVVLEALDLDLGRKVALKVMRTDLLERDEGIERFEREASALAAVNHPSVVTIYDRGVTEEGRPFLVMELLDGVPCSELVAHWTSAEGRADSTGWLTTDFGIDVGGESSFVRQVAKWGVQVAAGLAEAHAAGVFHRDVKPSNILITRSGAAILVDFGIAGLLALPGPTRTDGFVGTPAYLPPEALESGKKLDPRSDVYGLAATLYHLFTGRPPFEGTLEKVLAAVATRDPMPADQARPGLPKEARAILEHGLARRPSTRYASPTALGSDLEAFLNYRPLSVRPTTRLHRLIQRARRSRVAHGMAVGLALGGVLALVLVMRNRSEDAAGERFEVCWPAVPANLGYRDSAYRFIEDDDGRAAVEAVLSDLVETGHDPMVALTLRGCFYIDHHRTAEGLSDLRATSKIAGEPFARALIEQVIATEGTAVGVDVKALPNPKSVEDSYLSFFYGKRGGVDSLVEAARGDPRLKDHLHGAELSLIQRSLGYRPLVVANDSQGVRALALELVEEAETLERSRGFKSANLLSVEAIAHIYTHEFEAGLRVCEEALELSPWSFSLLQNASHCATHALRLEEALGFCARGSAIVGSYLRISVLQARALAQLGRPEEARRTLAEANFPDDDKGRRQRVVERTRVETLISLELRSRDSEGSKRAAHQALSVLSGLAEEDSYRKAMEPRIQALLSRDSHGLFSMYAKQLARTPTSLGLFQTMLWALPEDSQAADFEALRPWLLKVETLRSNLNVLESGR